MKPPFRVVAENPSSDTAQVLSELMELAKTGELIGFAFVSLYRRRRVQTGATGEASRSPVFTLGAVRILEQNLLHHLDEA
jgi:hypothetical protein